MKTPAERFWAKVDRSGGPDACWPWMASRKPNGYGQFALDAQRRGYYAHRFAWERAHGPIPAGLTVDHLCRTRECQNVRHMELVTAVENYRRAVATRTHCRNGVHALADGLFRLEGTRRVCIPCEQEQRKAAAERRTRRDRASRGGVDRRRKLTDEQRSEISAAVAQGARRRDMAERYGVSVGHVDRIVNGRRPDRPGLRVCSPWREECCDGTACATCPVAS